MFLLVLSFAFTSWNVRTEEFATSLFLTFLYPASLLQVSLYSLVSSATSMVFGPSMGWLVDRVPRLLLVLTSLLLQKLCIIGITILVWSEVDFKLDFTVVNGPMGWRYVLIVIIGAILRLTNVLTTISMERDWPKCIAHEGEKLSKLNSSMKRVDLVSKLAAPLFVSLIASFTTIPITILAIGGMGILSTMVEWICLIRVYDANHSLKGHGHVRARSTSPTDEERTTPEPEVVEQKSILDVLKESLKKPEFKTCIAMALLYLNALSFGTVMISYLLQRNVNPTVIAVVRGVGVVLGIVATFTFPSISKRIGVPRTGLWSVNFELVFLGLACASFWIQDNLWSVVLLVIGVNLSRFGLWTFDLSQTQILQESSDDDLGSLTGIQISMQNVFDLLNYGSTVVWSHPSQFWIPSLISFGAVFLASVIYTIFVKEIRGHLLHFEKIPLLRGE